MVAPKIIIFQKQESSFSIISIVRLYIKAHPEGQMQLGFVVVICFRLFIIIKVTFC